MEQIFMLEVYVKQIILKVEPPQKDEYELKLEEEQRKKEAELAALAAAAQAGKKGKKGQGAGGKGKGKGKGKKGKEPPMPSEEEMKFMKTCTLQMSCLPLFDFYIAHDNFVAPEPPPPPTKGKGKKAKPKPKKGKKGKGLPPKKIVLPSEPLPQPPFFGVGNTVMFLSRPSKLEEVMSKTPIHINVWNRDENMECIGACTLNWNEIFLETLQKAAILNPIDLDQGEFRNTKAPEITVANLAITRNLHCEEDLKPSGEIQFYIRLSCLGNRVISHFVAIPEIPEQRINGRKYLNDDLKLKDMEVVRHWEGTSIDDVPPVAYIFGAPDIIRAPPEPEEEPVVYDDFVAPYTESELAILAMGFPKGPCGGVNCPKRLEYRGSQHQFIYGESVKGKYHHGSFINKRDVHGPCGRLDCPLAKKVRNYICNEGAYKTCKRPCCKDFY